jgi:hypothetical protein
MERLTPTSYSSLVEAYSSVYNEDLRSELNEEQQIQEFLQVIDSLLEEGYDLSEYTYDELYEQYIAEGGAGSLLKSLGGRLVTAARGAVRTAWKGTAENPGAKEATKQALAKIGKAAVPIAAAVGLDQFLTGGKGREWTGAAVQGIRQAGHSIPSPGQPATAKPEPSPEKPKSQSLRILGGKVVGYDHVDMFDAVKGYLIGEGYADTEEAALKIMANMSEEWRDSIVEQLNPDLPGGTYSDFQKNHELQKKLSGMSPAERKKYIDNLPRVGPDGTRLKGA